VEPAIRPPGSRNARRLRAELPERTVAREAVGGKTNSVVTRTKPDPLPGTRAPFERHQFIVTAAVTKKLSEDDGDFHLVLDDGKGNTMIAEAPIAMCNSGATAYRRQQMAAARAAAKVCTKAEIKGVAFFDFFHNQTGVADNEIELHPILSFRCLSG
jgi:hypothetical protein